MYSYFSYSAFSYSYSYASSFLLFFLFSLPMFPFHICLPFHSLVFITLPLQTPSSSSLKSGQFKANCFRPMASDFLLSRSLRVWASRELNFTLSTSAWISRPQGGRFKALPHATPSASDPLSPCDTKQYPELWYWSFQENRTPSLSLINYPFNGYASISVRHSLSSRLKRSISRNSVWSRLSLCCWLKRGLWDKNLSFADFMHVLFFLCFISLLIASPNCARFSFELTDCEDRRVVSIVER